MAACSPLCSLPGGRPRPARGALRPALAALSLGVLPACEPRLTVGEWTCSQEEAAAATADGPIAIPWSTGFENRFCDYTAAAGFCYVGEPATYETVTSPVHSGRHAAAFSVVAGDPVGHQARCVRQGVLPRAAYYGAWYFIPAAAQNLAVWNLVHFQGGDRSAQHGLWDVSLVSTESGVLELVVYDFLGQVARGPTVRAPVPIASWFHVELYLVRAPDATGEVALYQDGRELFRVTGIVTDDSTWGQWYVGNFATGLVPTDSTVYVDDVTIRAAP